MNWSTIGLIAALIISTISFLLVLVILFLLRYPPSSLKVEQFPLSLISSVKGVKWFLWSIVFPLVVVFAIFGLGMWAFVNYNADIGTIADGQSPSENRDLQLFQNILTIVLGTAAIFITALGALSFFYLRTTLSKSIEKEINENIWRAIVRTNARYGYAVARLFEDLENPKLLSLALELHEDVDAYAKLLDMKEYDSLKAIGQFTNNWGYLLYLKEDPSESDKRLAISFANFLEDNFRQFPQEADAWADTIAKIYEKYGTSANRESAIMKLRRFFGL